MDDIEKAYEKGRVDGLHNAEKEISDIHNRVDKASRVITQWCLDALTRLLQRESTMWEL